MFYLFCCLGFGIKGSPGASLAYSNLQPSSSVMAIYGAEIICNEKTEPVILKIASCILNFFLLSRK